MSIVLLVLALIGAHLYTSLALWFWRGARGDPFAARCALLLGGVGFGLSVSCLATLAALPPSSTWLWLTIASRGVIVIAALPLYCFVMLRRKRNESR